METIASRKSMPNLRRHSFVQKSGWQQMEFDLFEQIWEYITSLLHIVINPFDNACESQLFSFRLNGKSSSRWRP